MSSFERMLVKVFTAWAVLLGAVGLFFGVWLKLKKGQRVIYVSPTGSRRRGKSVTRNAEILFVNEYGKRGQKARPAIRDANEACAEQMVNAQMAVYDKHLRSKDL